MGIIFESIQYKYLVIQFYSIIWILNLKNENENEKARMTKKGYFFLTLLQLIFWKV